MTLLDTPGCSRVLWHLCKLPGTLSNPRHSAAWGGGGAARPQAGTRARAGGHARAHALARATAWGRRMGERMRVHAGGLADAARESGHVRQRPADERDELRDTRREAGAVRLLSGVVKWKLSLTDLNLSANALTMTDAFDRCGQPVINLAPLKEFCAVSTVSAPEPSPPPLLTITSPPMPPVPEPAIT